MKVTDVHPDKRLIAAVSALGVFLVILAVAMPFAAGQNQPPCLSSEWRELRESPDGDTYMVTTISDIISDFKDLAVTVQFLNASYTPRGGDMQTSRYGTLTVTDKSSQNIRIYPESFPIYTNQNITCTARITNLGDLQKIEWGNLLITLTDVNGTVVADKTASYTLVPKTPERMDYPATTMDNFMAALLLAIVAVTLALIADLVYRKQSGKFSLRGGLRLGRHGKFFLGLYVLTAVFVFPLFSTAVAVQRSWVPLAIIGVVYVFAVLLLFKVTVKKVKLTYPLTSPTGQPDVYTGNEIPRPIYEDMQRYPWFFQKKRLRKKTKKTKN